MSRAQLTHRPTSWQEKITLAQTSHTGPQVALWARELNTMGSYISISAGESSSWLGRQHLAQCWYKEGLQ